MILPEFLKTVYQIPGEKFKFLIILMLTIFIVKSIIKMTIITMITVIVILKMIIMIMIRGNFSLFIIKNDDDFNRSNLA